ncbi:Translationally-controlled tumor protein [Myotis davidii]|uniref:Translationally-controlled tumor protein n=1 Tax=Myotis davidii TaxID=225400 RepID=L5MA95_MYODS|nr:Translationally-controlled tumor protein [Myotis davidii]
MFSDIYKIREIADGLCLEVEGKMVSRTEGNIDDSLIGGNASAEGPEGEGTESTVVTGVDIVMNHHLQETSFTKEAYKKYIKDYMKSIKGKLEEQRPERVKPFMTGAAEQIKHILANFKNYQFFIGENMNPDGMVALLDYREDGVTPYMIFFKDGLEMEKCIDGWQGGLWSKPECAAMSPTLVLAHALEVTEPLIQNEIISLDDP